MCLSVRPSVRPSATSRYFIEMTEGSSRCLAYKVSFTYYIPCCFCYNKRKFGCCHNRGTSLWNFVPNFALKISPDKSIRIVNKLIDGGAYWPHLRQSMRHGWTHVYATRPRCSNSTTLICYDTRCYFNVRSKADISQLNLPHGTDNWKYVKNRKTKK